MAKKGSGGTLPAPECKAILLCERVLYDYFTGRYSLIGVIEDVYSPIFPYEFGPYYIFLQITNSTGRKRIVVEIQDVASGNVIAREDQ